MPYCLGFRVLAFRLLLASLCGLVFVAPPCAAATTLSLVEDCLAQAAARHGVAYVLLRAIAEHESGLNPLASSKNLDGSVDVGLMQINSRWLPTIAPYGISKTDLLNPCVSAHVGAWILANNIRRLGLTWNAVGAYNAATPQKRIRYASAVHSRVTRLMATPSAFAAVQDVQSEHTTPSASHIGAWESQGPDRD